MIFTLEVTNTGALPAAGFRATNPMPGAVQFVSVAEEWAEVSVDGGNVWGKLAALKVKTSPADGTAPVERGADVADVNSCPLDLPRCDCAGRKAQDQLSRRYQIGIGAVPRWHNGAGSTG